MNSIFIPAIVQNQFLVNLLSIVFLAGIRFMLKIYGIKNCNSMKKAFDLLNELGLAYEFHDYKNRGLMQKR